MKKVLIFMLAMVAMITSFATVNAITTITFPDLSWEVYDKDLRDYVTVHHDCEREILIASQIGVINGYEDGTFKPDNPVTRAEFIKMLMGLATNQTFNFNNIPTKYTSWARRYVSLAEIQGIIETGKYTEKQLEEPITRLEMVCMLAKVQIKMKGIPQNQLGSLIYTDIDRLTDEEKGLLLHAAHYDLLEGMSDGTLKSFKPAQNITRGEAAKALIRIY